MQAVSMFSAVLITPPPSQNRNPPSPPRNVLVAFKPTQEPKRVPSKAPTLTYNSPWTTPGRTDLFANRGERLLATMHELAQSRDGYVLRSAIAEGESVGGPPKCCFGGAEMRG